ncbi:hypothetical protein CTEN210_10681 [Chaetoceros tenuissimus]|uniref:DNA helicase n=1 Tax=Chaetoceros tenuissimus TaxID=426638 RepID=A0AAD3D0A8_9STRA|nr:hypothetical protein CTEN210_10681 [Chaetoceros tenuissimus]
MLLCQLNLDNENITEERQVEIQQKGLFVYTTKDEVFNHNESELRKTVNKTNPLMEFSFQLQKTERSKLDRAVKSHFKVTSLQEAKTVLARGARVSLTQNKWAIKGLFNGSLGTVVDVRFEKGCSPLLGDLPLFVIVDFDNYIGPPWDKDNPTYVPIPMHVKKEDRTKGNCKCCQIEFVPLEIAFARTLHKVQGQSIGGDNPVKIMVFHLGKSSFEGNNPGLLYTGISRATSMGANDINKSAIYFNCKTKFELYTRIRDIHHKRKPLSKKEKSESLNESNTIFVEPSLTKEKYDKVKKRKYWTDFLDQQEKSTDITMTESERQNIKHWLQSQQKTLTNGQQLYSIVQSHSKRYKKFK